MKIAILTDAIIKGPISISKYTNKLVKNLLLLSKYSNYRIEFNLFKLIYNNGRQCNSNFKIIKYLFIIFYSIFNMINYVTKVLKIIKFCENYKIKLLHLPDKGRCAPSMAFLLYKGTIIITNHGMANLVLPLKLCYGKSNLLVNAILNLILDNIVEYYKWKIFIKFYYKKLFLITVSHSEKRNISKSLNIPPEKIKVIYHGVSKNLEHKNITKKELYEKYRINFPFIFHLSAYQPKKNVEGIIKAFAILKKRYKIKEKLVIGGRQPDHLKELTKNLGIENDVIFVGYIPEEDLHLFYANAEAFVFPSFHESFGMPILEAMAYGCPVITSNVFSMPEIAGKAAILVDPHDIEELANAIYKILKNKILKRKLAKLGIERVKKFTWVRCAKEHLKVYIEVNKIGNHV